MSAHYAGKRPLGISLLIGFFFFGATMCALTVVLLLFPAGPLDFVWRLKPDARFELAALGFFAIPLMTIVGAACGGAAIGLAKYSEWGRRVAIGVLIVNIMGDSSNALLRSDWRMLIGLPIGGLMISYLMSARVRRHFRRE